MLKPSVPQTVTKKVDDVGAHIRTAEIKDFLKNQMRVFDVEGQGILVINVESFMLLKIVAPCGIAFFSFIASKVIL